MRRHLLRAVALCGLAVAAAACGGTKNTTTAPSTTATNKVSWFSTLSPGGTSTRSFTVSKAGTVSFTVKQGNGPAIGVGLGLPRDTGGGCRLGFDSRTTPGITSSFSTSVESGQYCVQLYDLGTLVNPEPFTVDITLPQ